MPKIVTLFTENPISMSKMTWNWKITAKKIQEFPFLRRYSLKCLIGYDRYRIGDRPCLIGIGIGSADQEKSLIRRSLITNANVLLLGEIQCGIGAGLCTATANCNKTVCSKSLPFRVAFASDSYELQGAAGGMIENTGNVGFRITYFQTTC